MPDGAGGGDTDGDGKLSKAEVGAMVRRLAQLGLDEATIRGMLAAADADGELDAAEFQLAFGEEARLLHGLRGLDRRLTEVGLGLGRVVVSEREAPVPFANLG
jgi:hypothetical protein